MNDNNSKRLSRLISILTQLQTKRVVPATTLLEVKELFAILTVELEATVVK